MRLVEALEEIYAFADRSMAALLEISEREGQGGSPCCKDCWGCCYETVILTEAEAGGLIYAFRDLSPENKAHVLQQLDDRSYLEPMPKLTVHFLASPEYIRAAALMSNLSWEKKTPCMFLKDGLCLVYDMRPIVCRAYISGELTSEPCHSRMGASLRMLDATNVQYAVLRKLMQKKLPLHLIELHDLGQHLRRLR